MQNKIQPHRNQEAIREKKMIVFTIIVVIIWLVGRGTVILYNAIETNQNNTLSTTHPITYIDATH